MNYSNLKDYIQLMNEKKNDIERKIKKDTDEVLVIEENIKDLKIHMKKLKKNIDMNQTDMNLLQNTITETESEFNIIVESTNKLLNTVKEKHLPKFKILVNNTNDTNDADNSNDVDVNNVDNSNDVDTILENKLIDSDNLPSLFSKGNKVEPVKLVIQEH